MVYMLRVEIKYIYMLTARITAWAISDLTFLHQLASSSITFLPTTKLPTPRSVTFRGWALLCSKESDWTLLLVPRGRLETLEISEMIEMSLLFTSSLDHTWVDAIEVTPGGPLDSFWVGTGHQKDQVHVIRELGLGASPTSRERREDEDWVQLRGPRFNQSGLCNKSLIKTLNTEALWSLLVGKYTDVQKRWHTQIPREKIWKLCVPSQTSSHVSLYLAGLSDLYILLIKLQS